MLVIRAALYNNIDAIHGHRMLLETIIYADQPNTAHFSSAFLQSYRTFKRLNNFTAAFTDHGSAQWRGEEELVAAIVAELARQGQG